MEEKNKSTKKIITGKIIAMATIPTIIAGVVFYNIYNKKEKFEGTGISGYIVGNGIAPNLTDEEIQALLNKQVDESRVAFSINTEPVFKGKKGNIMFANPRYSAHDIDLTVTLDGKEIIKTAKISPDQYIEEISLLDKPLKAGNYNAIGNVKAYNRETGKVVGEVAVEIVITAK